MPWNTSRRIDHLPKDWPAIRRSVLRRDQYRCTIVSDGCLGKATEVDHIRHGDDHSPENLRAACRRCHSIKSSREGTAARARLRAARFRSPERHPGGVARLRP